MSDTAEQRARQELWEDADVVAYMRLSRELAEAGIEHKMKVCPCEDGLLLSIEGIVRFPSAARFAAACSAAGFEADYSAGTGWGFRAALGDGEPR